MAGVLVRLALAAAFGFGLAGCASQSDEVTSPDNSERIGAIQKPGAPLQCAPYARKVSGIPIFGDAYTWWDKAAGKYERGTTPKLGAVMVLSGYAGPNRAHVAVVRNLVSAREIKIDHANWLDDGQIYVDDPVIDVSNANDWSMVRVWNIRARAWGSRTYPVQGFIGPGPDNGPNNGSDVIAGLIASSANDSLQADNPQAFSSR